jgi:hypothetical protein
MVQEKKNKKSPLKFSAIFLTLVTVRELSNSINFYPLPARGWENESLPASEE